MADLAENQTTNGKRDEEEDYMGDLSQFLPPEAASPPKPSSKKNSSSKTIAAESSSSSKKKKAKSLNWQEQRKLDRERKQNEEDEQTLAKIEAPIPQSNVGFKLLKQMGYKPGTALGKEGSKGRAEPVGLEIRRSRAGIGREDPRKEKRKREEVKAEIERRNERALMEDFGCRQKSQWRNRRVVVNFEKAKAALDQLENREVVVSKKGENEEEEEEEEEEEDDEEEEAITEEDLQDILMKLREEHRYCLFCGCQYESMEVLLANCPGTEEDDH